MRFFFLCYFCFFLYIVLMLVMLFLKLFLVLLFCSQAGVVDVPIFSFYIGNVDTDTSKGVLTLGGVNQTHYEGGRHLQLRFLFFFS